MAKITKEELLKIAESSKLIIDSEDEKSILEDIEAVLEYISCLNNAPINDDSRNISYNINNFREDIVIPTNPEPILSLAPCINERYFVVPVILKQK